MTGQPTNLDLLRACAAPDREPSPQLIPVLAELVAGSTDRVACRNLLVSPRTYSRRLAELLDAIGVDTRFQCGFVLGRALVELRLASLPVSTPPALVRPLAFSRFAFDQQRQVHGGADSSYRHGAAPATVGASRQSLR